MYPRDLPREGIGDVGLTHSHQSIATYLLHGIAERLTLTAYPEGGDDDIAEGRRGLLQDDRQRCTHPADSLATVAHAGEDDLGARADSAEGEPPLGVGQDTLALTLDEDGDAY